MLTKQITVKTASGKDVTFTVREFTVGELRQHPEDMKKVDFVEANLPDDQKPALNDLTLRELRKVEKAINELLYGEDAATQGN